MIIQEIEQGNYRWTGPAATERKIGKVYLNLRYWNGLPYLTQKFVLFHEEGHIALDTTSEFEADDYARAKFIKEGLSLKQAYIALADMLPDRTREQVQRIKRHYIALMLYDGIENGNAKAIQNLKEMLWQ